MLYHINSKQFLINWGRKSILKFQAGKCYSPRINDSINVLIEVSGNQFIREGV
jgi:hypothetical protein